MRNPFSSGFNLPPGVTSKMIDDAFGVEGPLDCPICNDGLEMAGEECAECGYVSCKIHGCVECQRLEKLRPLPPDPSIAEAEAWAQSEREEKRWRQEVEDAPYGVITPSLQYREEQAYDYALDDFNFDAAREGNR